MMANNWDLIVFDPILIILGSVALTFMMVRERTSLKWVMYFASTLCYWIVSAIVVKMNLLQLQVGTFSNPVWIMLLFLGSSTLISIFLKPLATWLTGRVHWRKWWILLALVGLMASLVLTILNQSNHSIALYIFVALFLGLSLSSNSLYYLIFNEQFYYRIAPILSSVIISIIISFATFLGTYLVDLEATFFALGKDQYPLMSIILGFGFIIGFGIMFSFFQYEDPTYVNSFELSQLKQLPKYSNQKLFYILGAMFMLGIFFGLTQSSLVSDYIKALFVYNAGHSWETVMPWIRTFNQFFIIPQFLLGYFIYRKIATKFGFKPILIGLLGLSLFLILLMAFLDDPYLYVLSNFFLGLTFSQIFYAFFGMAIMWNYRAKSIPVTGLTASSALLGQFLVELVIKICKVENAGIFVGYVNGQLNEGDAIEFVQLASPVVIILFAIVGTFCIFAIVGLFFSFKFVFADYESLSTAGQTAKAMLREQQREKSRTRIFVDEVKILE